MYLMNISRVGFLRLAKLMKSPHRLGWVRSVLIYFPSFYPYYKALSFPQRPNSALSQYSWKYLLTCRSFDNFWGYARVLFAESCFREICV